MTIAEAIKRDARDLEKFNKICNHLRFNLGFNYDQIAEAFKKHSGMDLGEFEEMSQLAELIED